MTKQEVIDMMKGSKSEQEWNDNCDRVKAESRATTGKDYPDWWFAEINASGLLRMTVKSWNKD